MQICSFIHFVEVLLQLKELKNFEIVFEILLHL